MSIPWFILIGCFLTNCIIYPWIPNHNENDTGVENKSNYSDNTQYDGST